jgi:hypothetical protein
MSMKDINRSTCFLAILFSLNGQTEQTDPGNLHRRDAANPRGILFSSLSLSLSPSIRDVRDVERQRDFS